MTSKNKKNKKKKDDEEEKEILGLSQETKNSIWGILSIGIAIVSMLALAGKAGGAGEFFSNIMSHLFGWGVFMVPFVFGLLGVAFFKSIHRDARFTAILGTFLFVLGFLGILYIIGNSELTMTERIAQGGYLGVVLGYPLLRFLGLIAGFIVLVIVICISVLIALDIPIHRLIFREPEEEMEEDEADEQVLKETKQDNVVIKRGSQIIDADAEALAQEREDRNKREAKKPVQNDSKEREDREFVIKSSKSGKWVLPPLDILHSDSEQPRPGDINANVAIIKRTLSNFGITVEMGEVSIGPSVTQFTLRPAVGVKLASILALNKDLALALAAPSIRIEAPIPGKALVGIEIPNAKSAVVGLRDLFESSEYKKSLFSLPLAFGRDVAGYPVVSGLDKMPHLLIAGSTGSGKSVTINTILLSLLYRHSPDTLKLILVDPKRVELTLYNEIPHLITPVIVDTKKVVHALRWAVREMEKRYEKLSEEGSRDILSYNTKRISAKEPLMPMIVIVIDELADLMASHGRDVESAIVRLAQMARAVGIHLIVSTQRPSVEVITGLIKANIGTRMALRVASQIDSRTILDTAGAEKLLGNGDMLYLAGSNQSKITRVQGALVTEKEVKDVVDFIKKQAEAMEEHNTGEVQEDNLKADLDSAVSGSSSGDSDDDVDDDMFGEAKEVVIEAQKASASLLQRRLRVGYARAARLLDILEEKGIIGPGEGAKPREVYVKQDGTTEGTAEEQSQSLDSRLDDKIAVEE